MNITIEDNKVIVNLDEAERYCNDKDAFVKEHEARAVSQNSSS